MIMMILLMMVVVMLVVVVMVVVAMVMMVMMYNVFPDKGICNIEINRNTNLFLQ